MVRLKGRENKKTTMHQEMTDIECVMQTVAGDTAAFGLVVERYSQRVYALVSGIVGAGAEAEDLTQEVFIKAWSSLRRFSRRSTFSTWLYTIAYNTAISSKRARQRDMLSYGSARLVEQLPEEVEQQLFSDADIASLERALELLAPRERAVVELHYRQNLMLSEVAEVVGSNENNVKVIIHRARRHLAQLIKRDSDEQ